MQRAHWRNWQYDSTWHQLPSSCKHPNGGAQVDTGSFGWLLHLFCNQTICERRSSSWNRCYRRRITENNILPIRTKSFEEVQLCWCWHDPGSRRVPLHSPTVLFRFRLWKYSSGPPFIVGLGVECFKAETTCKDTDSKLTKQLGSWYDKESYGGFKQVDSRSAADAWAEKIFEATTNHDRSRYQVGMLWLEDENTLPNNYSSSLVQLKSLKRRLGKDVKLKERYNQTIKDVFSKGYIVEVDNSDCFKMNNDREWYLPHQPVVHPHKLGKVRRVLNGAAMCQGQSLNNALLTGPDLLQTLIHFLFRFRQYPHAEAADIEGRFLQIGVIQEDRPLLRFLWREDPAFEIAVSQNVRHIFVSKDSRTCANYALRRTATENKATFPEAVGSVLKNFYLDDNLNRVQPLEWRPGNTKISWHWFHSEVSS